MIKRLVEISREPAHLGVQDEQLLVMRDGEAPRQASRIPCEDIGMVVVDERETTYSHSALAALVRHGAALVVCGRDHLPAGVLLPFGEHTEIVWRIEVQSSIPRPLRKQLWSQIIRAKIRAQAANISHNPATRSQLLALARDVRSGDPSNFEAQAARIYWSSWLGAKSGFRRDPEGASPNNLLNYGYAILRASVARAIVGAGLLPALGLHHSNRSNAFCLADDLLEPLRPIVDAEARRLYHESRLDLEQSTKARLLQLLFREMSVGDQKGPLMVALHRYVASLVSCYEGNAKTLLIPVDTRPG